MLDPFSPSINRDYLVNHSSNGDDVVNLYMYLELVSFWFYVGLCITLFFTILYVGVYYYLV